MCPRAASDPAVSPRCTLWGSKVARAVPSIKEIAKSNVVAHCLTRRWADGLANLWYSVSQWYS